MKISCTQENLNQGLFTVSHLATKNISLPILNNILIQAKDNSIKLSATNLEIGVSCIIRGKVEQEGEFTVQSRLLADYINLLPKDRVDMIAPGAEDTDQVLSLHCKNYATKIKGQAANDFPVIPQIEKNQPFRLGYEAFHRALSQVIFAVSLSETRPEINGVLFDFSDSKLVMAATDSYRLAEKTLNLAKKSSAKPKKIIVPAKTLQELQRILGSFKDPAAISEIEEIEIYLSDNQILFVLDNIELISRLVEGQYPDYQQIIPQNLSTKAIAESRDLVKATKTAGLFARSGIYDVKLEFLASKKELVASATNNHLGENVSRLSAEIEGQDNATVLNYRYLLDGLQSIGTDQVQAGLIDASNPFVLKPVGKDQDYLYIIMPIKQ